MAILGFSVKILPEHWLRFIFAPGSFVTNRFIQWINFIPIMLLPYKVNIEHFRNITRTFHRNDNFVRLKLTKIRRSGLKLPRSLSQKEIRSYYGNKNALLFDSNTLISISYPSFWEGWNFCNNCRYILFSVPEFVLVPLNRQSWKFLNHVDKWVRTWSLMKSFYNYFISYFLGFIIKEYIYISLSFHVLG